MRVVEVFGPTIQGEGPYAGRACHFLRLGGCDYRCSWCDTMYAVAPEQVRATPELTAAETLRALMALPPAPMLVISGGNPALWGLDELLDLVRPLYGVVAVETQGSKWRDWLRRVDSLVVSPKPPSSGEATPRNARRFEVFMSEALAVPGVVLKVVVFDEDDLAFARLVHEDYPQVPFYLSAGTEHGDGGGHTALLLRVSASYEWLCERVAGDREFHDAVVLPQLHVVAWGARVGV